LVAAISLMLVGSVDAMAQSACQGNNVTINCTGEFSEVRTLCSGGQSCKDITTTEIAPAPAANTSQDNICFNPQNTAVDVTWEVRQLDVTYNDNQGNPTSGADVVTVEFDAVTTPGTPEDINDTNPGSTFPHTYTMLNSGTPPPANISISTPQNQNRVGVVQYRVKCTPKVQTGKLKIIKVIDGEGGDTFTVNATKGEAVTSYMLAPANSYTEIKDVPVGDYTITETPPDGWELVSINCGGDGNEDDKVTVSTSNTSTSPAACTITNRRKGSPKQAQLTLKKIVMNDGGGTASPTDFTLSYNGPGVSGSGTTGQGSVTDVSVPAGDYTFSESSVQAYNLTSLTCNGYDATNGFKISEDMDVTCVFVNKFDPRDERMEEETKRFIHRRVDNLLTHGPDRARLLRRLQEDQPPSMKDTGSIKDGPLKFSSTGISAAGSQRGTMMLLGSSAFGQPSNGTNPYFANEDAPRDVTNPNGDALRGNTFFDTIAGQASQLGMAQSGFKFGTSLSQLREMAAEHEEAKQRSKLANAGLSFAGQHMANPFVVPRTGFDIWMEGHISRYSDDVGGVNRDGDFRILYVGADYVLAPGILIGALVQIDDTTEDIKINPLVSGERGKIDGTGWMAGPYIGVRLTDKLFFDARAAWGTSNNDIYLKDDVNGPRSGSFDTTRWLTTATLTGNERYGPWRISPQIGLAYGHEEYDTYWNSLNQIVKGGDASIGRFTGAIEVGYQFRTAYGTTIEPHVSITGIYNFDTDDLVINGVMVQSDESRAKVEGGVIIMTPRGWGLRAAGNFDGIGGDDFRSYGGSLWLNIPLN